MRLVKGIMFAFFAMFLFSCNAEKEKLVGWWAIDHITIKGVDKGIDLSVNTLTFNNDGSDRLPKLEFAGKNDSKWRIEKDEDDRYLIIESSDNALAGRYRLFYFKDPKRKLYCMSLQSDSIEMVCSKAFQNYKNTSKNGTN